MHKKLIKKGQWGTTAQISNQLMKSAGMNFSQPSTFSSGLFNSKIMASNNLPLPLSSQQNMLGVPKSVDLSSITQQGITKLKQAGEPTKKQIRSAQNAENWKNFKSNVSEFVNSEEGKQSIDTAMSFASTIPDLLGKKSQDTISAGVNAVAPLLNAAVPGLGYAVQGLDILDRALGKSTKSFSGNTGISGYEDFSTQGKDYRLTQEKQRKLDSFNTNIKKNMFAKAKTNTQDQLKQQQANNQAIGNVGMENQKKLSGGLDYSVLTAKKGATLQDIRNYIKTRNIEKEVVQNLNLDDNLEKSEIQKFQRGGSIIPSGALHKNKHNLEFVNPELKGEITKKGVPVISYAEEGDVLEFENDGKTPKTFAKGGEVIQHAEIEKDEVILNLSLTKKLMELMKKDTPEATIEAGKILARELMEDVVDNTGLTEKILGNEGEN